MIKLSIDSHDLSAVMSRFTDAVAERAAAEQRERTTASRFYDAEDKIRNLKEKLAKYENADGTVKLSPNVYLNDARNMTADRIQSSLVELVKNAKGGNKINCIKVIREMTGLGLKEAKDLYEKADPPAPYAAGGQRW